MEAERVIDLLGLEYPADITATYNDLPTTYSKLLVLREHLYYLYTIGCSNGDDDMAEYALFANLHVRYRIMQCKQSGPWQAADQYYFHVYEQKLPRMKWRPNDVERFLKPTPPSEETPIEVPVSHVPLVSEEVISSDSTTVKHDDVEVKKKRRRRRTKKRTVVEIPEQIEPEVVISPNTVKVCARNHRFDRAYLEYHTRIGSDLVFRIVTGTHIYCHRMTLRTMADFNIFAISYYGKPTRYNCCDAQKIASLFFHCTGRFFGYDDAGIYISASDVRKPRSLMSMALRQLSAEWLSTLPSIEL